MAESSMFWDGTTTGDCGPYDADEFNAFLRKILSFNRISQGVIVGYENELEVTNPSGTTIRLATGAAIVDGTFYENTANIDFSVTAPGAGNNFYRIILRKLWVDQEVRADILGPETTDLPALVQTAGTEWDLSIAGVTVSSGGGITIASDFGIINGPSAISLTKRQGGSSTTWASPGSTDYSADGGVCQMGSAKWTGGAATSGTLTVTYPSQWMQLSTLVYPIIMITPVDFTGGSGAICVQAEAMGTTSFDIHWYSADGVTTFTSLDFHWMAIAQSKSW